jgi:tetratricopeptide (TPR) repeat protein
MSLLGRFLGGDRSHAFAEGMALLEDGRFAEAADRLRMAALGKGESASGSLASYHFRQALVSEGRRLMRLDRPGEAVKSLAEAVRLWELYPDLHCLHGTVRAQIGELDVALQEAHSALRLNPDYVEARLLEIVVLQELQRNLEAADRLNSLLELGRRVDHWIINTLDSTRQYQPDQLPEGLRGHLVKSLCGESEKEEVAAAVAMCRDGRWQEGLVAFAGLVERRPRYPDYRTRHAAALFQLGHRKEALEEVDAALALNESYRTAIDLKGLILGDSGRLLDARLFLQEADDRLADQSPGGAHEELFGAYLRGVLALLTGYVSEVSVILENWPDLVRTFARAELLLAAAEDLQDKKSACGKRLADLADEWSAEPLYFDLLVCHYLQENRFREAAGVLSRWPSSDKGSAEHLFLEKLFQFASDSSDGGPMLPQTMETKGISREAWLFLEAQTEFHSGDDSAAWQICGDLLKKGFHSERLVKLVAEIAAGNPDLADPEWIPPKVLPESCLAQQVYLDVRRSLQERALSAVESQLRIHPELLTARWLLPEFWFGPVRSWIA